MVFASSAIVGKANVSEPKATVYIGFVVVFVGILVKGVPEEDSPEHSGRLAGARAPGSGASSVDFHADEEAPLLQPGDVTVNAAPRKDRPSD